MLYTLYIINSLLIAPFNCFKYFPYNQATSKKVSNLSQWESAFSIYVAIYSTVHPCETPVLISAGMSSRDGCNWVDYDRNFRLCKQSHNILWDLSTLRFT